MPTSLNKFKEKGPPKLNTQAINQNMESLLFMLILPLFNIILREWDPRYIILQIKNIQEDTNPCEISIIGMASMPIIPLDRIDTIGIVMCTTEEYAIITLISLLLRHTTEIRAPP